MYKWKLWSNLSSNITNKAQKIFWGSTGAMLYQLSYEASLEAG